MSNVKQVRIIGYIPFDGGTYCTPEREAMLKELAYLNLPVVGLRINYGCRAYKPIHSVPPNEVYIPGASGGRYAHVYFVVSGCEAVNWQWPKLFCDRVRAVGGWINECNVVDIEDGHMVLENFVRPPNHWPIPPVQQVR